MTNPFPEEDNAHVIREKVNLLEEKRASTTLMSAFVKQASIIRYNKRVRPRELQPRDLSIRWADVRSKNVVDENIKSNWERPYKIKARTKNIAYTLETLNRESIPKTWNMTKPKHYFRLIFPMLLKHKWLIISQCNVFKINNTTSFVVEIYMIVHLKKAWPKIN